MNPPEGSRSSLAWPPYFSVFFARSPGGWKSCAGPTSIVYIGSEPIWSGYWPLKAACICTGMNFLYCCQFWSVILVPTGMVSGESASAN